MPYYHVTNKKVVAGLEDILAQRAAQHKAWLKARKELGVKQGYLDDRGLHAVVAPDSVKFDMKIWCFWDKKNYGDKVLKPRKPRRGAKTIPEELQKARDIFASVPKIEHKEWLDALNFKTVFTNGFMHFRPGFVNFDGRWVIHMGEDVDKQVRDKFPTGVKEITGAKYREWGGKD